MQAASVDEHIPKSRKYLAVVAPCQTSADVIYSIWPMVERIQVELKGVFPHPKHGAPLVFLGDTQERHVLSIVVGLLEAQAIMLSRSPNALARPMTHDLLANVLVTLQATVEEAEISDLVDNTYYGLVTIRDQAGQRHQCDIRPSDALALALRVGAPMYVHEHVFRAAESATTEAKTLLDFLRLEAEDEKDNHEQEK